MARSIDEGGAQAPAGGPALQDLLGDVSGRRRLRFGRPARLIGALAILALVAAAGWWGLAGRGQSYVYTTEKATQGELTVTVTATGSIQPTEQVDVSSELSGRIRAVNVDYNSPVKAGDVLAELVTDNLQAAVASSRAKLAVAKANLAKAHAAIASARKTLDSKSVLVNRNVSSPQELIDAQAAYDAAVASEQAAEAEVDAAQADLDLAETNLSKAKILSPIDGVVLTRNVDPGATVAASLSAPVLFSIAGDLRRMELRVDVDEADVGGVAVGQPATFSVDAYPDRQFPSKVETLRYVSETVQNVVTYKAVLTVDNGEMLLRPGMTATAGIVTRKVPDALLIPNAALRYTPPAVQTSSGGSLFSFFRPPRTGAITAAEPSGSSRTVWVMRDGTPTSVPVEIGPTDGQHTVVVSGDVKAGDELVVDANARAR